MVYMNLRALTICQNWLARKKWFGLVYMEGEGRSVNLLTRSLGVTHARADVNNMADLATKLSKLRPTFLRDFLSPDEENTLFLNDLNEEFVFFQLFAFILGANKRK